MKDCPVQKVRNFVLVGHAGAGKTSLADIMLYKSGVVSRLGSVEQNTSVSDFRSEEHERQSSIFAASLHCPWKEHHLFFIDTPGYADFCGEAIAAIAVADMAVIVIDAATGIGPGAIRAWQQAKERNIPRAFFLNGLDREQADFRGVLESLQSNYGATVCIPFTVPIGDQSNLSDVLSVLRAADVPEELAEMVGKYREALMDTVAESDEELMLRYLDGEELTDAEIAKGLHESIQQGNIVPVFCGSATKDIGIERFMDGIVNLFPDPTAGSSVPLEDGEWKRTASSEEALGYVFKSVTDPFIGQLTFLRIYSGTFKSDTELFNVTRSTKERVGTLYLINGKEQTSAETAGPGEIIALAKLKETELGDTLAGKTSTKQFVAPTFPQPTMSRAIFSVNKGDEDKIGSGLQRLVSEDPTLKLTRDSETRQTVLHGMGDQHINTVIGRLESEFKVQVRLEIPKVPYRETITGTGTAQYRHKKQTGGHGQFAEVHLRLEPFADADFEFASEVVGGNIPRNYIPAVEKGVVEAMVDGPIAGCKVINVRAVVFDGKHHEVDSSEMAFKIASRGAFREAMHSAKPILLEPIMSLKITFPEEYMGDVSGDLNSRRGRILGMGHEEGMQVLQAEVPLAETFAYSTQLRSITQGRGTFEMEFNRHDTVPAHVASEIQAAATKEQEEA